MSDSYPDKEIFENGHTVFLLYSRSFDAETGKKYKSLDNDALEYLCKQVGKETGVKMDWHCVGGRDNVLALNSREKVQQHILNSDKWIKWFEERNWKKEFLEYQATQYTGNMTAPNAYHIRKYLNGS